MQQLPIDPFIGKGWLGKWIIQAQVLKQYWQNHAAKMSITQPNGKA